MEDNIQKLSTVYTALNNIAVCGKTNLNNLMGSINLIEEVINSLSATKEENE